MGDRHHDERRLYGDERAWAEDHTVRGSGETLCMYCGESYRRHPVVIVGEVGRGLDVRLRLVCTRDSNGGGTRGAPPYTLFRYVKL